MTSKGEGKKDSTSKKSVYSTTSCSNNKLQMVANQPATEDSSIVHQRNKHHASSNYDKSETKIFDIDQSTNCNNQNKTHPIGGHSSNDGCQDTSVQHPGRHHRTRFRVALLGLAIAAVNCYAQATFCIAIVEMVLPSDYVSKEDSVGASSGQSSLSSVAGSAAQTNNQRPEDNSCPIEYKYRDYYDSWRFPATNLTENQSPTTSGYVIDISNRFDWDASRQGLLLGAFAVGTAPLQVLGGRLAEIYGAKWVLLMGCVGTAITNLTIPFLAHFSFVLLILNRVVMGVAQAGMEPGLMCLLAQWLTPSETGFFISMLLFAICIGFFLGSLGSSFLLSLGYGWPITYYVAGGMNLVVSILWLLYASSRPNESRLISAEELDYIEQEQRLATGSESPKCNNHQKDQSTTTLSTNGEVNDFDWKRNISSTIQLMDATSLKPSTINNNDDNSSEKLEQISEVTEPLPVSTLPPTVDSQAPWINILTTRSVWAFIICKISIRWCADVLGIELPTYLANVLHLSIKLNGIVNSVSSALFAIFSFITGYLVNELLKHQRQQAKLLLTSKSPPHLLLGNTITTKLTDKSSTSDGFTEQISKTKLRKLIQSFASFGSAICMILMTRYDCNILFSMSMLLVLSCCLVMGTGGELQIPYDMTSKYPGTLHGMACTLSVSGWLAPPLIGLILGDQPSSRYRWSFVWYMTAVINIVGGLVFVLFADASPRDFDRPNEKERRLPQQQQQQQPHDPQHKPTSFFVDLVGSGGEHQKKKRKLEESENLPGTNNNRGRHLLTGNSPDSRDGYYNMACKPNDNSPPRPTRQPHDSGSKQDLNWSSHFDRKLIRIRQVEDSFIKPYYLNSPDNSLAASTLILPYRIKQQQQPDVERNGCPVPQSAILQQTARNDSSHRGDSDINKSKRKRKQKAKSKSFWLRTTGKRQGKLNFGSKAPISEGGDEGLIVDPLAIDNGDNGISIILGSGGSPIGETEATDTNATSHSTKSTHFLSHKYDDCSSDCDETNNGPALNGQQLASISVVEIPPQNKTTTTTKASATKTITHL